MKTYSLLKAAFAAAVVSLLAACGGGDDAAPDVAWASPAVFAGAASKSYALAGCERSIYDDDEGEYIEEDVPLYNAKLVIAANGDVSIQAATTTTGTVTTVWTMAYADAQNASWSASGTTQTPSYYLSMYQSGRNSYKSFYAYSNVEGGYISFDSDDYDTDIETDVDCDMTDKLALQINAGQARAAKNLGSAAGVTSFDDYNTAGSIEGGNAFWYNYSGSPQYSNMRFNLGTGELASSTSTTGTYSPISLALPSTNMEYGSYSESLTRNNSFYDYKDAKSVCLGKESEMSGFELVVTAYGNKFMPGGGRFMMPFGLEAPQGPGGCGFGLGG